jgi:hypothetical protein
MKTYHLFDTAMGVNLTSFLKKKTALGVTDAINTRFITESRSDGSLKEKMESLDLNSPASLFNPFLNLEGMCSIAFIWHYPLTDVLNVLGCRF